MTSRAARSLKTSLVLGACLTACVAALAQLPPSGTLNRNPALREGANLLTPAATSPAAPDPRDSTSRPSLPQGVAAPDARDTPSQPAQRSDTAAPLGADPTRPSYDVPAPTLGTPPSPAGVPGTSALP